MGEKKVPIRNNFPEGFHDALGRVVVEFGRVEYEMKLALKMLIGKGFTIGMAEAEDVGAFKNLCLEAIKLAAKLPEPHQSSFTKLVERAQVLAPERNDCVHAMWTVNDDGKAVRNRPYLDRKTGVVDWKRSGVVEVPDLHLLANTCSKLRGAINTERLSWPDELLKEQE